MKTLTKLQAIVTIPLIFITAYFVISNIMFTKKSELVHAEIISSAFNKTTGDDGKYTLSIKVVSTGKIIDGIVLDGDVYDNRYLKGKFVEMYYDSAEPQNSQVKNVFTQWGIAMLLCFLLLYDLVSLGVLYITYFRIKDVKR